MSTRTYYNAMELAKRALLCLLVPRLELLLLSVPLQRLETREARVDVLCDYIGFRLGTTSR